jgi:hypothetical protein
MVCRSVGLHIQFQMATQHTRLMNNISSLNTDVPEMHRDETEGFHYGSTNNQVTRHDGGCEMPVSSFVGMLPDQKGEINSATSPIMNGFVSVVTAGRLVGYTTDSGTVVARDIFLFTKTCICETVLRGKAGSAATLIF